MSVRATMSAPCGVLLVEDDIALASLLSDALGARGYRVWHVETVADAELAGTQVRPDVIVLDLILPNGNGLLHLDCLKDLTDALILIASGSRRKDDAELASRLGAAGFVAKPYSVDELEVRMGAALGAAAQDTRPA